MDIKLIDVFEEPGTKASLRYVQKGGAKFLRADSGRLYPVDQEIVRFLKTGELVGNNRSYQRMYDRLAPFYDLIVAAYARLKSGGEKRRVMEYLNELDVRDGDKVLEISIGTGRNIRYLNPNAAYCGVDISFGMLKRCRRNLEKLKRRFVLVQAEAEALPLKDSAFDIVFSAGGFNFFNDRRKAVLEMLRVAKSGTKLMIMDETEKIRSKYEAAPVAGKFYDQGQIKKPIDFIPKSCRDVEYKEICDGELYALTFFK